MSARTRPRQWGTTIRCDADGCTAAFHSAAVYRSTARREATMVAQWVRGFARGKRRRDYCAAHADQAAIAVPRAPRKRRPKGPVLVEASP